jgi:flagella basal body P-ring formation protein FlgA
VCSARELPRVLVPKANLPKGHIVRSDDVVWKQLEGADESAEYVTQYEQIVGQEARRAFRAAEPILLADVRSIPLIKRGDIVTVVARSQGIVVRMDAKARGDGAIGQSVKVVSLDGRRELTVRVTGYHEAMVVSAENETAVPADAGTGLKMVTAGR